jgi:hypothetical protein
LRAALEHTPNLPDTLDEARGNFAAVDDLFHCSERPAVITRHEHEEIAIAVPTYDLRENPDASAWTVATCFQPPCSGRTQRISSATGSKSRTSRNSFSGA